MADSETIKAAMRALEDECATTECIARAIAEAAAPAGDEPAWVSMHLNAVLRLTEAADALIQAINWYQVEVTEP